MSLYSHTYANIHICSYNAQSRAQCLILRHSSGLAYSMCYTVSFIFLSLSALQLFRLHGILMTVVAVADWQAGKLLWDWDCLACAAGKWPLKLCVCSVKFLSLNQQCQYIVQRQQQRPFNGLWSGTTRVGRYQKELSPLTPIRINVLPSIHCSSAITSSVNPCNCKAQIPVPSFTEYFLQLFGILLHLLNWIKLPRHTVMSLSDTRLLREFAWLITIIRPSYKLQDLGYGDSCTGKTTKRNSSIFAKLDTLLMVKESMQAVKLCSNKIFQIVTD